jgi:hypothetical protein
VHSEQETGEPPSDHDFVDRQQCFGSNCYLHLQGETLITEEVRVSSLCKVYNNPEISEF